MTGRATCTDEEFIAAWLELGSPSEVGKRFGITAGAVSHRRRDIENRRKIILETFHDRSSRTANNFVRRVDHPACYNVEVENGTVIVFSDAHYWPNIISTAHKALLLFVQELKPELLICNGDAFDGSTISRWPRIGWDHKPAVKDELQAVDDRLGELENISGGAKLVWNLGNHDFRFETFLASRVPEYQGVDGFSLKDHFRLWKPAWSTCINPQAYIPTVVKHRWKGGIHAAHNNTLNAGVHYVTGHLHSLKVTPFSDLRGTRFGVDTGTLAQPDGPQFIDYTEDAPKNQRSGFIVLTYRRGELLWPEVVYVSNEEAGEVGFRGQLIDVETGEKE